MQIGLVGGTGKEGSGLAMRWARAGHSVFIGSRDEFRGRSRAAQLSKAAKATLLGGSNESAVIESEVVVVCVPYSAHRSTFEMVKANHQNDSIVVDITVPLRPPKVRRVHLPQGTSAALEAAEILGEDIKLIAGIHHVSASNLSDLNHAIDCDILVCGNNKQARQSIIDLVSDLGTRGLDAGVLANSVALESLTPVLIHMNIRYQSAGVGIRITGL